MAEWIEERNGPSGHGAVMHLVRTANVAASTIYDHLGNAEKNVAPRPIRRYEVAKRISDATDGAVSIAELCESHDANATTSDSPDPATNDATAAESPGARETAAA